LECGSTKFSILKERFDWRASHVRRSHLRSSSDLRRSGGEYRGDTAVLEAMLSEDFISIAPLRNLPLTKAQQIGAIQQAKQDGQLRPVERQWGASRVRFYGDTAVLTGWFGVKETRANSQTEPPSGGSSQRG